MKLKKITKSVFFRKILGLLIYLYIVFCYKTSKWSIVDLSNTKHDFPAIYAFWHGRLAMMPYLGRKNRKMNVLISTHSDGEIIKNAMSYFNFSTIGGSSKKNSFSALKQIIKKLQNNENISITPDGPRGPSRQINSNVIDIARITKTPIIPMIFSISRNIILNSWDNFMVPLPFSKGILIYGDAIEVPEDADLAEKERLKEKLALGLDKITIMADSIINSKKSI
jgi:lysophospholipid acyltransferase (LPLAT)-like uncharacterized protein